MRVKILIGCAFYAVTVAAAFGADAIPTDKKMAVLEETFGDGEEVLQHVNESLSAGYGPLLDDIRAGVYPGVTEKTLGKYMHSDLDVRTIGFPNWITALRGHILLQKVKIARLELQLLKKDGKGASPAAKKKSAELKETMTRLAELEKQFVD